MAWEKEEGDGEEEKESVRPKWIKSWAKAYVKIRIDKRPISLEKYDSIPQLGRFTLRFQGKSIALGTVDKYKPADKDLIRESRKLPEESKSEEIPDSS